MTAETPETQATFPTDLCRQIGMMAVNYANGKPERGDADWYRKKTYIYATALAQYPRIQGWGKQPHEVFFLDPADATKYKWADSKTYPAYLSTDRFRSHTVLISSCVPNYYDYRSDTAFWVDFAAAYLGGGAFDSGFVQEETMCAETPDLANLAAWHDEVQPGDWRSHLKTRMPAENAVGAGNPTPIVIKGVHRVLNLDSQHNFPSTRGLEKTSFELVRGIVDKGVLPTAQYFNVLAAAAPKLPDKDHQTEERVLVDLFNTFVAMFTLASKQGAGAGKGVVVNTGPIGCGAFNNRDKVVYLLQALAAEHVGDFTLNYWAAGNTSLDDVTNAVKDFKGNYFPQGGTLLDLIKACTKYFPKS